jgi:hypothetical protein
VHQVDNQQTKEHIAARNNFNFEFADNSSTERWCRARLKESQTSIDQNLNYQKLKTTGLGVGNLVGTTCVNGVSWSVRRN